MPRIGQANKPSPASGDFRNNNNSGSGSPSIDAAMAVWREFELPAAWQRSRKGNLWREWQGITLSIFPQRGGFGWCVADEDGPRYSPVAYETEQYAMSALGDAILDLPIG